MARIPQGEKCLRCSVKRKSLVTERVSGTRKFVNSAKWKKTAALIRARDDWTCQNCILFDRLRVSKVKGGAKDNREFPVDHIAPRHVRPDLKWRRENLLTICPFCHASKIGFETNGFEIDWLTDPRVVVLNSSFVPEQFRDYNLIRRANRLEIDRISKSREQFLILEREFRDAFQIARRLEGRFVFPLEVI